MDLGFRGASEGREIRRCCRRIR